MYACIFLTYRAPPHLFFCGSDVFGQIGLGTFKNGTRGSAPEDVGTPTQTEHTPCVPPKKREHFLHAEFDFLDPTPSGWLPIRYSDAQFWHHRGQPENSDLVLLSLRIKKQNRGFPKGEGGSRHIRKPFIFLSENIISPRWAKSASHGLTHAYVCPM